MDIKGKLKEIEEQVSVIKDQELRKIAFEKLMNLLSSQKKAKIKLARKPKDNKKSRKLKSGRPSQKKILTELLSSGFFDKPKTVSEIVDNLRLKTGHLYKPNELSTPLVRMLRSGQLTRDENEKGKYEWKRA
jgi:hypothetical protein